MNRYLSEENLGRVKKDFGPVLKRVIESCGEYDLRLREDYFNIYCRGNSLAKIEFGVDGAYEVSINKRFAEGVFDGDRRFAPPRVSDDTLVWRVTGKLVNPFFQTTHLRKLAKNIDYVDHSEEANFEQQIIADNLDNPNRLIVDRQILHPGRRNDKLDLLALVRPSAGAEFNFHVIEVKMGNNPELSEKVAGQLDRYCALVKTNVESWKKGYRKTVEQLRALEFFPSLDLSSLKIGSSVTGSIDVFGYSGIAKTAIRQLKLKRPDLRVKLFSFELGDGE